MLSPKALLTALYIAGSVNLSLRAEAHAEVYIFPGMRPDAGPLHSDRDQMLAETVLNALRLSRKGLQFCCIRGGILPCTTGNARAACPAGSVEQKPAAAVKQEAGPAVEAAGAPAQSLVSRLAGATPGALGYAGAGATHFYHIKHLADGICLVVICRALYSAA